jgi:phosphatidylglycerol:prolipoprotein diacylglycerol transferase
LALLVLILVYTKKKRFDGELIFLYMAGYGLGRLWIERMRTDQLLLWGTKIPVSMVVAFLMVAVGVGGILWNRRNAVNC